MGKRSITRRKALFKARKARKLKSPKFRKHLKKRGRKPKYYSKEDDESYILPSKTEESIDFDSLDLEDETIDSQPNPTVIHLTDDEEEIEKSKRKIRTHKSMEKSTKKKKRKWKTAKMQEENINNFAELNYCYNKLSDLINEYNFSDIADVILKINNDIEKDKSDKTEKTLFRELRKIYSVIKKKEDINMMCLSILNSKKNNYDIEILSENNGDNEESKYRKEERFIEHQQNEKKETKLFPFIDSFKKVNSANYKFDLHYYNSINGVHIYDPKSQEKRQSMTFNCKRNSLGCKARCVVIRDSNIVTMKDSHNHQGVSYNNFCKIHPEFKDKNWEHVQVIIENGELINVKQC